MQLIPGEAGKPKRRKKAIKMLESEELQYSSEWVHAFVYL